MNQANFLQVSEHCSNCHEDYFDTHSCGLSTTGVKMNFANCGRCKAAKILEELNKELPKYCQWCGHKL